MGRFLNRFLMNVTASTRTHGFGHIIWKTGGEKSENSPEIEYLGNRMPHKINFHSLQFLKNCLHKTPENFFCGSRQKAHRTICYLLTTFKGHGEPLARLHYDFSHPLIFRPAFYGTPTLAGASTQHQRTIAYCPRQQTHRTILLYAHDF